jgi:hypothetical protein
MNDKERILEEILYIRKVVDKIHEDVVEIKKILTRMVKNTEEFEVTMRERRLKWIKQND